MTTEKVAAVVPEKIGAPGLPDPSKPAACWALTVVPRAVTTASRSAIDAGIVALTAVSWPERTPLVTVAGWPVAAQETPIVPPAPG